MPNPRAPVLSKPSANLLSLKSLKTSSFVLCVAAILFGSGCASTGALQPHHAFRQSATPYQAYQGYQGYGNQGAGNQGDYIGYGGSNTNNAPAGFGQQNFRPPGAANPTTGYYGGGSNSRPSTPPASYSYQPAYSGGFNSGSC